MFECIIKILLGEAGKGIRADLQDRFGSDISGLKIFQDRIGSDPSLKKCERIGRPSLVGTGYVRSKIFGYLKFFSYDLIGSACFGLSKEIWYISHAT